jgi:hypothetical protein
MSCAINCTDIGTHDPEDLTCKGPRSAGASSIVIFLCLDNVSDITNPTQINAAIAADEAILVENIRFGSNAPTPALSPKLVSCGLPGVLHNTYPINITDYSYNSTNNDLWQTFASGVTAKAILAWDCLKSTYDDTSRFYNATGGAIQLQGGLVSPDDDDEAARFEITGSFKGDVSIITTPAGVFS